MSSSGGGGPGNKMVCDSKLNCCVRIRVLVTNPYLLMLHGLAVDDHGVHGEMKVMLRICTILSPYFVLYNLHFSRND